MVKSKGAGAAALLLAVAWLQAVPVRAQETPSQFDAANAENRRHSEAESALRNQAHDLRNDQAKALLQCQGAGSASARNACANNVGIEMRRRGLELDNQAIGERNSHNLILKGIGVHRVP
jgi:hypothetical protein